MPAHSEIFPWPSHYGHFNFFESRMRSHGRVRTCNPVGGGVYELTRHNGDVLRVFICECYSYGVAEYFETVEKIGDIDVAIINSAWCGYTDQLKIQCRDQQVGVFTIGEFMGALNRGDFWNYLTEDQEERYRENGLI